MSGLVWFPFFPDRWLLSRSVRLMTLEQRGVYVELLCHAWRDGSIPSNLSECAALIACPLDVLEAVWPRLESLWEPSDDGTLVNPWLEEIRTEQISKSDKRRIAAQSRWGSKSDANPMQTSCKPDAIRGDKKRGDKKRGDSGDGDAFGTVFGDISNPVLRAAWDDFGAHRKANSKTPYSEVGLRNLRAALERHGICQPDLIAEFVRDCMAAGWQGLPPDAMERFAKKKSPGRGPSQRDALIAELEAA